MKDKILKEGLPRWQKLLLVLHDLSDGTKKPSKFEDIVVNAFKKFPETFHLRGYKEYPDSGDLIHKPLYDMRKNGLLLANNKTFSLTDKGIQYAIRIKKGVSSGGKAYFKPSRDIKNELDHIVSSEAFSFFQNGNNDRILDTDFFQYLGVSVHSSKNEFSNRMSSVKYAIEESKKYFPVKVFIMLNKYHDFLIKKFEPIIKDFSNRKERVV